MSKELFGRLKADLKNNMRAMMMIAEERYQIADTRHYDLTTELHRYQLENRYDQDREDIPGWDLDERWIALKEKKKKAEDKRENCLTQLQCVRQFANDTESTKRLGGVTVARDNPRRLSYAKTTDDLLNFDKRVMCKMSKLLDLDEFGGGLSKVEKECICELYGMALQQMQSLTHEIMRGGGVYEAYKHHNSCMQGKNRALELYAENPDKVGVLVVKAEGGKPISRSLIWSTDQGRKVVDRTYPNDACSIPYIQKICDLNEWSYRKDNTISGNNSSRPLSCGKGYSVTMDYVESFPYLDTFFRGALINGSSQVLLASRGASMYSSSAYDWKEYTNTDNSNVFDDDRCMCERCEEYCDEEDMSRVQDEMWCDHCTCEYACWIEEHEEYCQRSECIYSEWHNRYILSDDAVYCERYEDYIHSDESVEICDDLGNTIDNAPHGHCDVVEIYDGTMTWRSLACLVEDKNGDEYYVFVEESVLTEWGCFSSEDTVELADGEYCPKWLAFKDGNGDYQHIDALKHRSVGVGGEWCMNGLA